MIHHATNINAEIFLPHTAPPIPQLIVQTISGSTTFEWKAAEFGPKFGVDKFRNDGTIHVPIDSYTYLLLRLSPSTHACAPESLSSSDNNNAGMLKELAVAEPLNACLASEFTVRLKGQ